MEIKKCFLTQNDCYKTAQKITPKGIVVHSTGANNPQGIGATTALAFANQGAKVVLVYKKINRVYNITTPKHISLKKTMIPNSLLHYLQ